ncbi:MAG: endolytic transglycosylase MltG, partial [bacterium]
MNRKIFIYLTVILAVLSIIAGLFFYGNYKLNEKLIIERPINLTVAPGDSLDKVLYTLEQKAVISSSFLLQLYFSANNMSDKLKAGDYIFSDALSGVEVAKLLISGDKKNSELAITIPEGYNIVAIQNELLKNKLVIGNEWMDLVGKSGVDYSTDFSFLLDKPKNIGLEGYLFPDTYRFFKKATPDEITRKMLVNFDKKLSQEMRTEIKRQGKT